MIVICLNMIVQCLNGTLDSNYSKERDIKVSERGGKSDHALRSKSPESVLGNGYLRKRKKDNLRSCLIDLKRSRLTNDCLQRM